MRETIYRDDAIKALHNEWDECLVVDESGEYIADICEDVIDTIPSADRSQETCLKEAEVLLKATRNLLNKQNESIYVLDMLEETVTYYGVECDGSCLIEDIDAWLDLYGSEEGADDE